MNIKFKDVYTTGLHIICAYSLESNRHRMGHYAREHLDTELYIVLQEIKR